MVCKQLAPYPTRVGYVNLGSSAVWARTTHTILWEFLNYTTTRRPDGAAGSSGGVQRLRLGALDYEPQHDRDLPEEGGEGIVRDHALVLRYQ